MITREAGIASNRWGGGGTCTELQVKLAKRTAGWMTNEDGRMASHRRGEA